MEMIVRITGFSLTSPAIEPAIPLFFPGRAIFILEKSSGNGHKFTRHRACTLFHGQTPRDITNLHLAFLKKEIGNIIYR